MSCFSSKFDQIALSFTNMEDKKGKQYFGNRKSHMACNRSISYKFGFSQVELDQIFSILLSHNSSKIEPRNAKS